MELLGVGPLEFILVLVIVLLLFSPKDIVGGARKLGSTLNQLYKSDLFRVVQKTSEELRNLPNRLAQEAALDDLKNLPQELKREVKLATDAGKTEIFPKPEGAPSVREPASAPASPEASIPAASPAPAATADPVTPPSEPKP
jgi:Sec-independent protein translocase protein TatA